MLGDGKNYQPQNKIMDLIMAKKDETKEVAAKKDNLPEGVFNYGDDSGAGFAGTDAGDQVIPFISILQGLSPIVQPSANREDCKVGMLFNTVTEQPMDGVEGLSFVPAAVGLKEYVEWVPRGGNRAASLVARHDYNSSFALAAVEKAIADGMPMGRNGRPMGKMLVPGEGGDNELIETKYVYGVLLDADEYPVGYACISFTSTKMKAFNNFYTNITSIRGNPPCYAFRTKLTAVAEKNAKGEFYNFKLSPLVGETWVDCLMDPKEHPAFKAAKELQELLAAGSVTAAFETQDGAGGASEQESADSF